MGKRKKSKGQKDSPDYLQLKENLRYIQHEIERAKDTGQRRQIAQLKLKMLILKLRYNAEQLNRTALAAQDLHTKAKRGKRGSTHRRKER